MKTYLQLKASPFIGTPLNSKINVITPYRYLVSGNYLIFYIVKDEMIEISRIIYGRRDYIKILFESSFDSFNNEDAPE